MRALRAALFAAVAVALAAVGHSSQSAHDLPPAVLLAAFAATALGGWCAAGRRRGPVAIGAGLLAVQGALHTLFSGTGPGAVHHHPGPGHGHTAGTPAVADALAAATDQGAGSGMLVAHVLAAGVCALWLARGEAALFQLARAVLAAAFTPVRLLLAAVRLPATPRPAPVRRAPRPSPRSVVLAHALVRRGPPARPLHRATAPGATV